MQVLPGDGPKFPKGRPKVTSCARLEPMRGCWHPVAMQGLRVGAAIAVALTIAVLAACGIAPVSPSPIQSPLEPVILCGNLPPRQCDSAVRVVLAAVREDPGSPRTQSTSIEFISGTFCYNLSPTCPQPATPEKGARWLGSADVTLSSPQGHAYVNVWKHGGVIGAELAGIESPQPTPS